MNGLKTTEEEFRVLNEINKNLNITQREISHKSGMSLGMTNIIIKRLIKVGYVKVKQLSKKRVQYLLTPKGFTEKAKKSYNYVLRTIQAINKIQSNIQESVLKEYKNGQRLFIIYGSTELADLVEISIRNLAKQDIICIRKNGNIVALQRDIKNATVLLTEPNKSNNVKGIDVLSMLS